MIGDTIDPAQLPRVVSDGQCVPVQPNDFVRANSVMSVAHAAGLRTAWADKHPVYNAQAAGHGTPGAVTDPFNTEINADCIPSQLTDTRANTVTFPVPNPNCDPNGYFITDTVGNTEAYDSIKADAVLNEIDGLNSWGTRHVGEPAIFGMNFQTVSVAEKIIDPFQSCARNTGTNPPCNPNYVPGGYEPSTLAFTPQLTGAVQSVDAAVGAMVSELARKGELASTDIIVTAKHGQSPIDPAQLQKIGHAEVTVLNNAGIPSCNPPSVVTECAQVTDDDIALVWLEDHAQTATAVKALADSNANGNPARIDYVLSGDNLTARFGNPTSDPRTPDLIIQPLPGTIYSSSTSKVAEHGGFAEDDVHVALLVVKGSALTGNGKGGTVVSSPVRTYQVAPTILDELGLDPNQLVSVRAEGVQVLPNS